MILEPSGPDGARQDYPDNYLTAAGRGLACPDCASEPVIRDAARGHVLATVIHDPGCPWLNAAAVGQPVLIVTHRTAEGGL